MLERTAYPAIMPSGFQIVQSTLLKIDGFKFNIDYVQSLNKIFKVVFINSKKDISGYFIPRNSSDFPKLNNLRLEN